VIKKTEREIVAKKDSLMKINNKAKIKITNNDKLMSFCFDDK